MIIDIERAKMEFDHKEVIDKQMHISSHISK